MPTYTDTTFDENTQSWYKVIAVDAQGNRSADSSVVSSSITGDNATRINAILAGRSPHFAYSTPADPVTTRQVTVTSASQFNAESAIDGTQITVGNSFSGNVTVTGSDINVLMNNAYTITGNVIIGAAFGNPNNSRIRWTGGNVGTTYIHRCDDVLVDNLYMLASGATTIETAPKNAIGTFATVNRVAAINSTFRAEGNGNGAQWALNVNGTPTRSEDIFLGNVKFETDSSYQNNRFQFLNRLMIVDSVMNPDGQSSNGVRLHETTDVWIRDTWREGGGLMNVTESSPPPSVANGLFDNFDNYVIGGGGYYANVDASNTGTVQNSTFYSYPASFSPFTDGGGNVGNASWGGTAGDLPDSSTVGAIRP